MAPTRACPPCCRFERGAAEKLAAAIAAGGHLPELTSPVLLDPGEVLHANVDAVAWRYQAIGVDYAQRRGFAVGGPIVFGLTAAATAAANRRAREEAERQAAPQWRPLGHVPVLATNRRFLVLHQGAWASVWYEAIRQMRPAVADDRLEVIFANDPPYAVQGPWAPYLAVLLATLLAERVGFAAVTSALISA